MSVYSGPQSFVELTELLKNLPGVGKRSADRMALAIFHWNDDRLEKLATLLATLHQRIHSCPICGNLSDAQDTGICSICASATRDSSCICVVEDYSQIYSLEVAGMYNGLYHVLGGRIAPLEGKMAESLAVPQLIKRIENGGITEVILALSQDMEGQATSAYIAECLAHFPIRISRLAAGLPAGADLSYADPATIAIALRGRTELKK